MPPSERSIVVACDTVPQAQEALEWTIEHMYEAGDTLYLVHCFQELEYTTAFPAEMFVSTPCEEEQDRWRDSKSRILEDFVKEAKKLNEGVVVVPRLVEGDPRDSLPLVCEEVGAVALVVGSRGRGAVKRAFLGSTSSDLAHNCETPVVVVHAKADGKDNIVLAVDGDARTQRALGWCIGNLCRGGNTLHLVRCYERLPMVVGPFYGEFPTEKEEAAWREHHATPLNEFAEEAKRIKGDVKIQQHLIAGDVRDELVRLSKDLDAVALVVGSRGQGAVKRALLGSTSSYLAHHSTVPLAIVRDGQDD
jgi:nucleotide-binding universal stress UspA family protein